MPAVVTENLTKIYGADDASVTALDHVSLTVEPGEFVAVMGPSGCGKSTLLHLVGGLDRPTAGRVLLDGHDLSTLDDEAMSVMRRRSIGFVFQFYNLIPVLNAQENAALPLLLDGVPAERARPAATQWLERFELRGRQLHRPDQLSGGEQQRVAIARALVADPSLILADEPTGNLDSTNGEAVMELLKELHQGGATILMVTHDPRYSPYAERTVHLFDGRIVEEGVALRQVAEPGPRQGRRST